MTDAPQSNPLDHELAARLFHERIIVLGETLEEANGNRLVNQLLLLAADDPKRDITFWISSPGGSIPAMLAIQDVMRIIPNDVATVAFGWAASAGQFLLSAGTKGKRYVLPHARILMHQGSSGIRGTAVDVELQADDLRYTRDTVLGLIAEFTGQSFDRIMLDSQRDRWWTADGAVEYGFADQVVQSIDELNPRYAAPMGIGAGVGA